MQPAEGSVIAGKYELVAPLARGGMGMVWTARHVKLGSRLAVKFVDPSFVKETAFLARFEREARAAAAIESPHVVHVQDFGVEDGTPYLVMELLQGEDLGARLRRQRRLSIAETARILAQAGHALRRAHEAGIIHRDLKPANLYLARLYDQEIVKILDFGIAKETAGHVGETTTTGEVIGSPHYMGPEQARADKDIDHRSDLWSVGVLVYRMLTGALPFPGDVMGAILAKVFVEPPPPVAAAAPDLPAELDTFFARALAKKKEERFQTIDELVDAFLKIAEQRGELPPDLASLTVSSTGPRAAAAVPLAPARTGAADLATPRSRPPGSPPADVAAPPASPPAPPRSEPVTAPTLRPDPSTPASLRTGTPPPASLRTGTPTPASLRTGTPPPASAPPGPPALANAPPEPSMPAPGPASTTSPSIATSITSVHDTPVTPIQAPRRRATWLAAGAAGAVLAGVALSVWLGGSPGAPSAGSAGATPSAVAPTPSVSSAPGTTPEPQPSTRPAPSTSATDAPTATPSVSPTATPSAAAAPSSGPAQAATPPPAGSPAQKAAPATSGKRSTRSDEWGF